MQNEPIGTMFVPIGLNVVWMVRCRSTVTCIFETLFPCMGIRTHESCITRFMLAIISGAKNLLCSFRDTCVVCRDTLGDAVTKIYSCFRYSEGVSCMCFLNAVLKDDFELYPTCSASSSMVCLAPSFPLISIVACSIR